MNYDPNKSKPRGHYPGYTSRFKPLGGPDEPDESGYSGDTRDTESDANAEYGDYDETEGYEGYEDYEDYELAPYKELARKTPAAKGRAGGKSLNLTALWERLRGVFAPKPKRPALKREPDRPIKKARDSGNIKSVIPLPERLAPKPASFLQTGDYGFPLDDRPSLKGLKLLAAFVVLAAALYLLTNNLADSLADNDYSGAVMSDSGEPGGMGGAGIGAATPARNYNMSVPYMEELLEIAADYPVVYDICDSIWKFPTELLELVIKNNETAEYVAEYLIYGQNAVVAAHVDVSGDMTDGLIPHFIQWDRRWGYSLYGTQMMGLDGCGPTSLAMVAAGLTGNVSYNPRYVADFAQDKGYITSDNSTTWTLMSEGSKSFGITPKELTLDGNVITAALRRGEPIIASMGPGDFTKGGHFIVMTGVTDTGTILINDANSRVNTATEWDLARLMTQIKNLWAFTVTSES